MDALYALAAEMPTPCAAEGSNPNSSPRPSPKTLTLRP